MSFESLDVLDTSHRLDMCFANIFSCSVACLFIHFKSELLVWILLLVPHVGTPRLTPGSQRSSMISSDSSLVFLLFLDLRLELVCDF